MCHYFLLLPLIQSYAGVGRPAVNKGQKGGEKDADKSKQT
jgi:hypothetical protein